MSDILRKLIASGHEQELRARQYLFFLNEAVYNMYLVQSGEVGLMRRLENGNPIILLRALAGEIAAEASLYSECYHWDAVAVVDNTIQEQKKNRCFQSASLRNQHTWKIGQKGLQLKFNAQECVVKSWR